MRKKKRKKRGARDPLSEREPKVTRSAHRILLSYLTKKMRKKERKKGGGSEESIKSTQRRRTETGSIGITQPKDGITQNLHAGHRIKDKRKI